MDSEQEKLDALQSFDDDCLEKAKAVLAMVNYLLARVYQPKIKKMLRSRFWRGCEKSQVV
jgi:hypothetical protein